MENPSSETATGSPLPSSIRKLTFNGQSLEEVVIVDPENPLFDEATTHQFTSILKTSSLSPKNPSPETPRKTKMLISPRKISPSSSFKKPIQTNVKTIIYILAAEYPLFPLIFEITQLIHEISDHNNNQAKEITTNLSKLMRQLFLFDDTIKRQASNPIESIVIAKECLQDLLHVTALIQMKEYAQTTYHARYQHLLPQDPDEIAATLTTPLMNNILELIALFTYSVIENMGEKVRNEQFIIEQFEGFFAEAVLEHILPILPPLLQKKETERTHIPQKKGCCTIF